MTLAVASYENIGLLADDDKSINLAWMVDEREYLSVDMEEYIKRILKEEVEQDLPFINSYFVQDPYGEKLLKPAVARFFSLPGERFSVVCGAGVNSLLHALAGLACGGTACIAGDVYPDFPHWVTRLGGTCLSWRQGAEDVSVAFLERPGLMGDRFSLSQLADLCERVGAAGGIVLIDESYGNYYPPADSAVTIVPQVSNLVVVRGFSKAYWLGGLRLGYCVASLPISEKVRTRIPPLLASSLSLRLGYAVLELGDVMDTLRLRIVEAKTTLLGWLPSLRLTPAPISADYLPYVLLDGPDELVARQLKQHGIVGKLQPFWCAATLGICHRYRLSVPLRPDRLQRLYGKVGTR